jgi:hypothetical protein
MVANCPDRRRTTNNPSATTMIAILKLLVLSPALPIGVLELISKDLETIHPASILGSMATLGPFLRKKEKGKSSLRSQVVAYP